MQLKRTFLQCKLERFKLLTTVLRLPLQHVDFLTAYSAEGMPVMQEFCDSIQSALEAALTLVHCVLSFHAFIHYGGTSIIVIPPPPPFHSVSFHCAGFLHIISLVQWHGHPSEQCVQYLIPNYKSWEASRRFHVASASPAVAAACGVYVQLTVASCFLILQEPSWDYRIVQVEGTISSCHWVYASIQIADFLVRKSQSCSGFCLYYKMCSITLFCSLHFHTENTLVFPRKPYCVIWSERMKCF